MTRIALVSAFALILFTGCTESNVAALDSEEGPTIAASKNGGQSDVNPQKLVWVCHFDDHTHSPWAGGGTTLDGDYVVKYREGGPYPDQYNYCESREGEILTIPAVAAEKGHKAQLLDRIDGYPDR